MCYKSWNMNHMFLLYWVFFKDLNFHLRKYHRNILFWFSTCKFKCQLLRINSYQKSSLALCIANIYFFVLYCTESTAIPRWTQNTGLCREPPFVKRRPRMTTRSPVSRSIPLANRFPLHWKKFANRCCHLPPP